MPAATSPNPLRLNFEDDTQTALASPEKDLAKLKPLNEAQHEAIARAEPKGEGDILDSLLWR